MHTALCVGCADYDVQLFGQERNVFYLCDAELFQHLKRSDHVLTIFFPKLHQLFVNAHGDSLFKNRYSIKGDVKWAGTVTGLYQVFVMAL
jgi:hypothetical protein